MITLYSRSPVFFAAENVPCGSTGTTCTKAITVVLNGMTLKYVKGESHRRVSSLEYESSGVMIGSIGEMFTVIVWKGKDLILKFDMGKKLRK